MLAVPGTWLVVGFLLCRSTSDPRPVHVGSMVKKVAMGQVLLSLFSKYYSADNSYTYFYTEIEQ